MYYIYIEREMEDYYGYGYGIIIDLGKFHEEFTKKIALEMVNGDFMMISN